MSRSLRGLCVWVSAAACALCCCPPRLTGRDKPEPRAATQSAAAPAERGRALYDRARYAEALREFEAALKICQARPPGDPHLMVGLLSDVALCLCQLGRAPEGLPKAQAAYGACRRLKPPRDHPDAAKALSALAHCLRETGRLADALIKAQAALAMRKKLHGRRDHPDLAESLGNVGLCLYAMGRCGEALQRFQDALAVLRRLHGDRDHPMVATALDNVAGCLDGLGQAARGLPQHRAALAMRQRLFKGQDHPDLASSLSALAGCLQGLGRPDEALPKCRAALAMSKRLYKGRDSPYLAPLLSQLGICLHALGRSSEALPRFQEGLAMFRRLYGGRDHPGLATSLGNVAACLDVLGRSGEALPKHQAALAMGKRLSKGRDHPQVAGGLNNLAYCLHRLGRSDEALAKFEESLAMLQRLYGSRDHPSVATGLDNVATCLDVLHRFAEALPKHRAGLAMWQRLSGGQDHPQVALMRNNLATCLYRLHQAEEALAEFDKALPMLRRLYRNQDHPLVAATLRNAALCLQYLNRPNEALPKFREALAMGQRLRSPETFIYATGLGKLYLDDLKQTPKAIEALETAVAGMEHARIAVGGHDLDRARYFAQVRTWRAFELMVRAQLRDGKADKALRYAERGRALGLRDVLERGERLQGGDLLGPVEAAAKARGDTALVREIGEARRRHRDAMGSVSMLTAWINLLRGRRDLTEAQRRERIEQLGAKLAAAHDAHLSARRAVFNLVGTRGVYDIKPLTADQTQALLSPKQRLLAYVIGGDQAVVLLVPPAGREIRGFALKWPDGKPVTGPTLREAVDRYMSGVLIEGKLARGVRRGPVGKRSPAEHAALGYRLFRGLVPEVLWQELKSAAQVYVVPDSALHRLPFEALVVDKPTGTLASAKDRRYWLDAGPPLAYGPSATVLANRKTARDQQLARSAKGRGYRYEAVLLGDPIFDRKAGPKLAVPADGVVVMDVKPGSAAERLGIRRGAVITRYGPHEVGSVKQLDDAFERLFGDLRRKKLKAAPKLVFWQQGATVRRELSPREELGARVADLTEQLRERLAKGAPFDAGARAAAVERGGYLSRYGSLTPLPGTRREVLQIYRTLTGREYQPGRAGQKVAVLLGEDATRTRLFQAAAGCRYLHLATHGLVDTSDRAIYSSLALTQPAAVTPEDFGFLTLVDLFDHWWGRLGATELVVLSACDTQRGRIEAGEGVFGISWGFLYAGAPAVIASLWQVADESTAEMMGRLYEAISRQQAGQEGAAKLRAFVAVRKALRRKHPQPYFWAPFIYIGDPR